MVYQGSPDTQLSDYALQQGNPKSSVFHKQRLLKTAVQLLKRQKKKNHEASLLKALSERCPVPYQTTAAQSA